MIVSLHVATGAALGALAPSRLWAVALGFAAHTLGDRLPHYDIKSRRFEIASGVGAVLLLAARRGAFDRTVFGALAGSIPDVEHVFPLPRPGGRKLFPSHRFTGWHRPGGVRTSVQLLVAGAILGTLLAAGRRR